MWSARVMQRLRWSGVRRGGATVWRGSDGSRHAATVEQRGSGWGVTMHWPDGDDEVVDGVYTTHEGAQRKAEHVLWG